MTNEELKAAWAVNIDSLEKFQEVFQRTRSYVPRVWQGYAAYLPQRDGSLMPNLNHDSTDVWPLQRDMIREAVGFYPEPTTVLKWLRSISSNVGLGQMFPHVSPVNKEEIAFTPDGHQAKLDRKQRMSVGRFLRKFLIFLSDAEIQRLDQQHRSELDTSYLLAETVEAIQRVYEGMDGDTGCMRYGIGNFSHDLYHPSAAYCSPGMAVAYTEDANGTVKSRSVIWTNPDDEMDKRYVRIYGDPILKKKLESNGFKMLGLAGAKLRIYRDPSFTHTPRVVMPWIDPAGGIHAHNADRSKDSEHAIRFVGEDFITLVSKAQVSQYQRAGIYPVEVQTQNGHVDVPEVDKSTFHYECAITGKSTNRMDVESVIWIDGEGTVRMARAAAVGEMSPPASRMNIHREGQLRQGYCTSETRAAWGIPGYSTHFNDEATREAAGLCMLDKAFYTDSERYDSRTSCVFMEDAAGERRFIRKADALMLYTDDGDKFIHIDMVKALKSEGCLPVAVLNGYRGIAHKTHKHMVQTRGGKRVITTRHDVTKLWDGAWEYTRNVTSMSVAGITLSIGKADVPRDIVIPKERVIESYQHHYKLEDKAFRTRRMTRDFMRGFMGGSTFMKKDDAIVAMDYYNKTDEPARMYEAAKGIMLMKDDAEWMRRTLGYQTQHALPWARVVIDAWEGMLEYDKAYEMAMAEANAVEAAPPMQAVIDVLNTLADGDMDRLIAEVDDTLATAVTRRWPRLQQMGDPDNISHRVTVDGQPVTVVIASPDGMGPQNGAIAAPAADDWVNPAMNAVADVLQGQADDQLLAELRAVGLAPVVIDEHTDFTTLPSLT